MIIYKFFPIGKYEKEEEWVNKMCSDGYALVDFKCCKYYFKKCKPNEYYYSIELLENFPSYPNHEDFLNYLEDEWSVEYVCDYRNWVFFRRKKILGKFSLFSDTQSKTHYFKKILMFRFLIVILLIFSSILNIIFPTKDSTDKIFSILLIIISIIIVFINTPTFIKYIKLKR